MACASRKSAIPPLSMGHGGHGALSGLVPDLAAGELKPPSGSATDQSKSTLHTSTITFSFNMMYLFIFLFQSFGPIYIDVPN